MHITRFVMVGFAWATFAAGARASPEAPLRPFPVELPAKCTPSSTTISPRMKSGVTLEQALESLSLERVVIPSVQEKVSDGLDRSGDTLPVGAVVQRGEQRFVVGATFWTGSNAAPESLEFVHRRGDDKHIFILQRTPRVVYIEERVCGCETPGFGSPCPACHETVRVLYGPLAPGVKLESERKVVAYDDVQVRRIYSDGVCRVSPPP